MDTTTLVKSIRTASRVEDVSPILEAVLYAKAEEIVEESRLVGLLEAAPAQLYAQKFSKLSISALKQRLKSAKHELQVARANKDAATAQAAEAKMSLASRFLRQKIAARNQKIHGALTTAGRVVSGGSPLVHSAIGALSHALSKGHEED